MQQMIVGRVAFAASLFDHDGISIRVRIGRLARPESHLADEVLSRIPIMQFMNSPEKGDNLTNEQQAAQLISRIQFSGLVRATKRISDRFTS